MKGEDGRKQELLLFGISSFTQGGWQWKLEPPLWGLNEHQLSAVDVVDLLLGILFLDK